MEQAARAAGIADRADPETGPNRDVEQGRVTPYGNHGNTSRVSLPQSHRRSMSLGGRKSRAESTRSRTNSNAAQLDIAADASRLQDESQDVGDAPIGTAITTAEPDLEQGLDDDGAEADPYEEIPWGPEHPCFPHPNPHVPMASALYANTRIIRVRRDWMVAGDFAPTFTLVYPEILEYFPCFNEATFRELVQTVNSKLVAVFSPWNKRSWVDTLLGVATGWLWDDLGLASTEKGVAEVEAFLERWNVENGAADGVQIIPLRRTGYLSLDIQIPDPQIVEGDDFETEVETQTDGGAITDGDPEGTTEGTRTREGSFSKGSAKSASNASASKAGGRGPEEAASPVPPIPREFLEEGAALAVTMGGFRNSDEEERTA